MMGVFIDTVKLLPEATVAIHRRVPGSSQYCAVVYFRLK